MQRCSRMLLGLLRAGAARSSTDIARPCTLQGDGLPLRSYADISVGPGGLVLISLGCSVTRGARCPSHPLLAIPVARGRGHAAAAPRNLASQAGAVVVA